MKFYHRYECLEENSVKINKGEPHLKWSWGTSLAVQWLRLHASNAGGVGSIPVQGSKIPYAAWRSQKLN